jgi:N-carbamoylputrescine amidase
MPNTITVAAIQMNCIPGKVEENLCHADRLVAQAAARHARLVLLPELMPGGYLLTEAIWNTAQTMEGSAVTWLRETASRFQIYLGFSFLEVEGEDFYNSFVLAGPDGNLLGRVRKNPPASVEAYFYRGGDDRHVIETPLGRIGVSICYEGLLYDQLCQLHAEEIDLLLWPSATGRPKPFIPGDVKRFDQMLTGSRAILTKALGVPVILANRCGPLETELPGPFPFLKSSFPGLSFITDGDGTLKASLDKEGGVIVAEVTLGNPRTSETPRRYGNMWAIPVPWYAFIWPMSQRMGEKAYLANPRRRQQARLLTQAEQA